MITHLAAPSICVIDDEKEDYEPILDALLRLGLGCVHIKGQNKSQLPPKPFQGLRVVFTDLHLSGHIGKDAASHTAKVFSEVVSTDTAPIVVVIWSKYKDDVLAGIPADDQPTESQMFQTTLLESFPQFRERLVFLEMDKPKLGDRPSAAKWIKQLQRDVRIELAKLPAFGALWAWEAFVRDAAVSVTAGLTTLAVPPDPDLDGVDQAAEGLPDRLKRLIGLLVREQGGSQCSAASAPRHLATVLGQSLLDQLEHLDGRKDMAQHGKWLSDQVNLPKSSAAAPGINGFLLSSAPTTRGQAFLPGNVYCLTNPEKFKELFGTTLETLVKECYNGSAAKFETWKTENAPKPVLIEISPVCDVHQCTRRNALLIGGMIFPSAAKKQIKRADSLEVLPTLFLRWPMVGFPAQSVCPVFFSRLKVTLRPAREPRWLVPWFRLRELPTASLRNWHAGHAARVGYVSVS